MSQINIQYFKTPFGELILGAFNGELCLCDWRYRKMRAAVDKRIQSWLDSVYVEQTDPLITQAIAELEQYFSGARQVFEVPLLLVGTEFQQQVWQHLISIKYAQTASYLELARKMQNQQAVRAVAAANGANAISIIVPCHRIIGSDGKLVGYAGGLAVKKKLLQLENCTADNDCLTRTLELFN